MNEDILIVGPHDPINPCPFCNTAEPHLMVYGREYEIRLFFVRCLGCVAEGPIAGNDSPQKAIKSWNTNKALEGVLRRLRMSLSIAYAINDHVQEGLAGIAADVNAEIARLDNPPRQTPSAQSRQVAELIGKSMAIVMRGGPVSSEPTTQEQIEAGPRSTREREVNNVIDIARRSGDTCAETNNSEGDQT